MTTRTPTSRDRIARRIAAGLTVTELAERAGVSAGSVGAWTARKITDSAPTSIRIVAALEAQEAANATR